MTQGYTEKFRDMKRNIKRMNKKVQISFEKRTKYYTDGHRHLVCHPYYSKPNLHQMAKYLDIKRCWFHKDHYDIPKRRIQEIENQCILVSPRDIVKIIKGTYES
jgi:hypothetical protein